MKDISTKFLSLVLLIPFCLVLSTVFALDDTLAIGVISAKYFWFYSAMGITSIVSLLVYGFGRNALKIYPVDILLVLFVGFVLTITYLNFNTPFTTKWILLLLLLVLFFYLRIALKDRNLLYYLQIFLIITGLVEAIWGLRQLYGFTASNHNLFKLTGSFFNSGPYSGYLAVIAPLALYSILKDKIVFKRKFFVGYLPCYVRFTVSALTFVCIVLVLPAAMSRAAWIAMMAGCGFVITLKYLPKKQPENYFILQRKKIILILSIVFVLIAAGAVGIYQLKKNSADGRFLIWKTSLQLIPKYPLGVGLGHFSGAYGKEQAAYFASGKASAQEELIAGNPEYAFNEYLQIIIEFGVVPAIVLFLSFVLLIYMGIKRKSIAETGGLISLLIFASMSYPFNLLPFLIILVFFMALILVQKQPLKTNHFTEKSFILPRKAVFTGLTLSTVVLFGTIYQRIPIYNAYKEWNNLKMAGSPNAYPEMMNDYKKISPYLSDQTPFLFEYAQCLSKAGEYQKSNRILEQSVKISCDPMLYNIIGKNYQSLKKFKFAEDNFIMASHIIPSRIYPYYLLANLYAEKGDRVNAIRMAKIVLETDPKVESTAVNEMREKMREIIGSRE